MFGIKSYILSKGSSLILGVKFIVLSLAHPLRLLPPNDKKILFSLGDMRDNADVSRYQYLLVNFFVEAGYNVYLCREVDWDFFKRLRVWGRYLYFLKNVKFVQKPPKNTKDIIYLFDNEDPDDPMLKLKWKKLVYFNSMKPPSWKVGNESITVPYSMFPGVYYHGQHQKLDIFRNNAKRVKAFFFGNTDEVYYKNPVLAQYGQLTRREALEAILESGRKIIYQPAKNVFSGLMRGKVHRNECVICDFSKFAIRPSDWLDTLSRSDFFICFAGADFPMCHNAVEALAVGTIPILSYADWFEPPLEHRKNAIVYTDKEDLLKKMDEVMAMGREEIERMRQEAVKYYEKYRSHEDFFSRLEKDAEPLTLTLLPRLTSAEGDPAAERRLERVNALIGGSKGRNFRKDETILRVENVSKKFCRNLKRSMLYGMTDIGKNVACVRAASMNLRRDEFWAVKDVSFEIKRGESLGLIGSNGSGKTTMLKMLNGIFWPDHGKITVKGRVGALIAVGAGFHPLLTGRENVYTNAAILGMDKNEVDKKFDAIVDFSGIEEFLDTPVKHYSSGMFVRLGFAVAIHCDPDILLVDEVLTVGDMNFQRKCKMKLKELEKQGVTKIFVSHDLSSVDQLCDKAIHLSNGVVRHYGRTRDIIEAYKKEALDDPDQQASWDHEVRYGTRQLVIKKVEFLDQAGNKKNTFKRGEYFKMRAVFHAREAVVNPEFTVGFWTSDDTCFIHATTRDHGLNTQTLNGDGEFHYVIDSLPVRAGRYYVSVGSWDASGHVAHDQHEKLYELRVKEDEDNFIKGEAALVDMSGRWEVNGVSA